VPSPVRAVELGDLGHQGVVGVGVRQEGADGEEDLRQGREGGREEGVSGCVCAGSTTAPRLSSASPRRDLS